MNILFRKNLFIYLAILIIMFIGTGNLFHSFTHLFQHRHIGSFFSAEKNYIFLLFLGISLIYIAKELFTRSFTAYIISITVMPFIIMVFFVKDPSLNFRNILLSFIFFSIVLEYRFFIKKTSIFGLIVELLAAAYIIFEVASLIITSDILILFSITVFVIAAIFVLNPLLYKPIISYKNHALVRELLQKYSTNPVSYIIMEDDKQYYFSEKIDGVIGYKITNNVAVVAGEPICSEEDMVEFLVEFKSYCKNNSLAICFCQITGKYKNAFDAMGFGIQEYGKEAIIDLTTYSIAGTKAAKIRWAYNKMTKLGVTVTEYKASDMRNDNIEEQIQNVSEEWLKTKKSSELSFMLGRVSFEKIFDKRFFVAKDENGYVLAFVVCFPYNNKTGYFIDIMRRKQDSPLGIMEKLIIETCQLLKEEGVEQLSLGLAPLANIEYDRNTSSILLHGAFKFIYESMNSFYGFKSLYEYKKKFNPSSWNPRYISFYPKIFTPQIGYAIIKAKNPKGIKGFLSFKPQNDKNTL